MAEEKKYSQYVHREEGLQGHPQVGVRLALRADHPFPDQLRTDLCVEEQSAAAAHAHVHQGILG